jgi:hypothetical protein
MRDAGYLGLEQDVQGQDRYGRGGRERHRQEPGESQQGPVAAHDAPETPGRHGEADRYQEGGGQFRHGMALSRPLERGTVKI